MDFRFVPNYDKRILNPAGAFFDKPIVYGQNPEVPGIYAQPTNPGQRYVESILSMGSISGENLKLLNVKYVILAKEVDYAWYLEMLDNSDLVPVFDSENLVLYKNPEQVSRFYGADEFSPEALEPLSYESISPVKYEVKSGNKKYTVFIPPNLDSSDWVLDGRGAPSGFYAAWEDKGGKVEYSRFKTYEFSYIISLISVAAVGVGYIIPWRRPKIKEKEKH
jgi:hypothetical protein